MKFSIVTTLYNSAPYLDEFYARIIRVLSDITSDYEIIFVNDGSPDNSLEKVLSIHNTDPLVRVIDLSRNFGHHKAIMEGLRYSRGDYIFLIDSDLEEEPEWLVPFYEVIKSDNVDAVVGKQNERKGGAAKKYFGKMFYKLFNILSNVSIPTDVTIARLMSKRYVDSLTSHRESEMFFAGLCQITGFSQAIVDIDKDYKGSSSYSLPKRIKQAVDAITSFSNKPLYFIFLAGCVVFSLSLISVVVIVLYKLLFSLQAGYASLIVSIWAMGGIIMICTGVIGIYLGKIFAEVKNRPVIVRKVFERNDVEENTISS